jgi:hypothetical protein
MAKGKPEPQTDWTVRSRIPMNELTKRRPTQLADGTRVIQTLADRWQRFG